MPSKNVVVSASSADGDMILDIYVGPGGVPSDLRARLTISRSDGSLEISEDVLTAVPRTLSGISAPQALNLLRDIRNYLLGKAGYA